MKEVVGRGKKEVEGEEGLNSKQGEDVENW